MREQTGRADILALAGYILLACAFFWPILFSNVILTGFDTFTIFYPHRAAAARTLLTGHLPLWNPDHFLGAPLLANPQVAVLYPLNWPFFTLPDGPSLAWTMALHFVLAAVFMYLFAHQAIGLTRAAAWLAGVAFAFGGFMGQQTGHLNQVSVAAWLPLVLLLAGRVWQSASWRSIVACGITIALQFLAGHSQESYMILVSLAAYVIFLALAWRREKYSTVLWRRLGAIALAVILGVGLSAVQLVPTLELSRLSIRSGGLSFRQASSFSLSPQDLPQALLPNYLAAPPNEMAGYIGTVALLLAMVGARWFQRRPQARFLIILGGLALTMALGRYTPLYWLAYYIVPGVSFFRVPARWLFVYSFAVALLAGMGLDVLMRASLQVSREHVVRLVTTVLLVGVAVLTVGAPFLRLPSLLTMGTWGVLTVAFVAGLLLRVPTRYPALFAFMVAAVIIGELYTAGRHLEYNRYAAPESLTSLRPAIAFLQTQSVGRVLSISDATWDPGDLNEIKAGMAGTAPGRVADYVAAIKNKELLTPNLAGYFGLQSADGYDGGVLPLKQYVELEGLFLPADQLSPDGRLRDHLKTIPEARLLGLLGIDYIITDKNHDIWLDDVYYDLAFASRVTGTLTLTVEHPFIATAIGIISRLEGNTGVERGTVVAEIAVSNSAGDTISVPLVAGVHTAAADQGGLPSVGTPQDGLYYYSVVPLPLAIKPERLTVKFTGGSGALAIRGISLIDRRTRVGLPITVTPDFTLVHNGDVKVYRNNLPDAKRVHIVHEARVLGSAAETIAAMSRSDFDPARAVILAGPPPVALSPASGPEEAVIEEYTPQRIAVGVSLSATGILVLSDAYYPGWEVRVDGVPAPLLQANYFFRGVTLSAGRHRVEFVYRPRSLVWGGAISLLAAIVALAGIVRDVHSRPMESVTESSAATWCHAR